MKRKNNKNIIFILIILFIGVGFALLSTNLSIRGTSMFSNNEWKIYFDNVRIIKGEEFQNVAPTTVDDTTTSLNFEVFLPKPGDVYKFYVDIVNDGTLDAQLNLNYTTNMTEEMEEYANFSITYIDGVELGEDLLRAYDHETLQILVEYKKNITEEIAALDKTPINVTLNMEYTQAKGTTLERKRELGADYLMRKAYDLPEDYEVNSCDEIDEMAIFHHEATDQTPELTDYRFIGCNPNNYATYNGVVWRIIGVFNIDGEYRIKLIQDNVSEIEYIRNDTQNNNWPNSTLERQFNEGLTPDFYIFNDLSKYFNTIYYLGGSSTYQNHSAENYYNDERSNNVFDSTRSTNYKGIYGLMYASDYLYTYAYGVDDTCYNDGSSCNTSDGKTRSWLYKGQYEWMLNPLSNLEGSAIHVNADGEVKNGGYVTNDRGVRRVLYLPADYTFYLGNGTRNNPYIIPGDA